MNTLSQHIPPEPMLRNPARACALLTCATIWVMIGAGVIAGVPASPVWHTFLPDPLRVTIWWAPAAFAVWTWITHRWAPTTVGLLFLAPAVRGGSYTYSYILWATGHTNDPGALEFGWYYAALYGCMSAIVVIAAFTTRDDPQVRALLKGAL